MKNNNYLITLIIYGTSIFLLMLIQVLASLGCFNALSDQALEIMGSVLPQIVVMFGIPFIVLLFHQKINQKSFSFIQVFKKNGWHHISFKNVCLCFILGICLYILNIFIASVFGVLLRSFGYQFNSSENAFSGYSGLVISIILTAVLPAICEEFLHRGVLLNGMMKQFGVKRAILWSSLLFGLMHMNIGQFFYATILGWFMAVTALSAGSLWGSIIVHFTNNALATYFSFADELKLPGTNLINYLFGSGLSLILTILIIVIAIGEILKHMARDKFKRNLDIYTVRYLASQNRFTTEDFESLKVALPRALQTLPTWKATAAYIETFDEPKKTQPFEKSLLMIICAVGVMVTLMSFIWGTW